MAVSVLDSRIYRNTFGTPAVRGIFSDEAYTKRLIEVESALARAESKAGVIPAEAGRVITKALEDAHIE